MQTSCIFIDEAGNLDFSPAGSRLFLFVCLVGELGSQGIGSLHYLRKNLLLRGLDIEFFHASENKPAIRAEVFTVLNKEPPTGRLVAFVITKALVPTDERESGLFYAKYLALAIKQASREPAEEYLIITDTIPIQRKRKAVEKAVRLTLTETGQQSKIYHHSSRSHFDLQCTDYFGWAIWRHLTRGDELSGRIPALIGIEIIHWPNL